MKLLLLTGMSGAGKSVALKMLEDFGFYCVDNLPVPLLKNFVELPFDSQDEMVAVGIDIRSGEHLQSLSGILEELSGDDRRFEILFLDAEDAVLLNRYKETRRNHPLSRAERIQDGISREREAMRFLKERADYIIDTSHLLTKELRSELQKMFMDESPYKSLNLCLLSFGYKYGIPADADLVFDVRFLPNPFYIEELRYLTGNDAPIRSFVMKYRESHIFLEKLTDFLTFLIPQYIAEGKNQLVICIGCTGGKHRSVTMANELFLRLSKNAGGYALRLEHRDIGK